MEWSACRLCVATGRRADDVTQFACTLLHRVLACPATQPFRDKLAPDWVKALAGQYVQQGYELDSACSDLVTRALAPSPAALIDAPPSEATFNWIVLTHLPHPLAYLGLTVFIAAALSPMGRRAIRLLAVISIATRLESADSLDDSWEMERAEPIRR